VATPASTAALALASPPAKERKQRHLVLLTDNLLVLKDLASGSGVSRFTAVGYTYRLKASVSLRFAKVRTEPTFQLRDAADTVLLTFDASTPAQYLTQLQERVLALGSAPGGARRHSALDEAFIGME
jgi:hypothetical protein